MRIETVCTGDELLTGLTADTNSLFFQTQALERLGERVHRSATVGDVREDIIAALTEAAARADVVLVSGGLGPTADDITAACAAQAFGDTLTVDQPTLVRLKEGFAKRGLEFTANNARQAQVPSRAEVVPNAVGAAPMFIVTAGTTTLFFVPGVPREYRHLVEHEVIPRIERRQPKAERRVRVLKLLKTVGLPESHLDERVKSLSQKYSDVTVGFRTHLPENHLKLLVEGADEASTRVRLAQVVSEARAALFPHVFGEDADTLPGVVLASLRKRGQSVALAESCTGGGAAALLASEAGASDVLKGALVTYQDSVKTALAGVTEELLTREGAVSSEVALSLAMGAKARVGADWGVGITGWAGPSGGDERTPVGTVFIAVVSPSGAAWGERKSFGRDRMRTQSMAAAAALDLLRRAVLEATP